MDAGEEDSNAVPFSLHRVSSGSDISLNPSHVYPVA
jgi:hypothetical protein